METFEILKNYCVLTTGATGFIGQHVVNMGLKIGAKLHALTRKPILINNVECWQSELTDQDALVKILRQVQPKAIFHLAAEGVGYGSSSPINLLSNNVIGFATLMEAIKQSDLKPHVVIAGSGFEYSSQNTLLKETDPIFPSSSYGVSKAAMTMLANLYANYIPITVLRLFNVYGVGEKEPRLAPYIIAQAKRGEPIELTAGEQVKDYTYVKDVAEAFWRTLLIKPNNQLHILNMASGKGITLRYFVEKLVSEVIRYGLKPDIKFGAKVYRKDEAMFYVANVSCLEKSFNWLPNTSLETGLAEMVAESFSK